MADRTMPTPGKWTYEMFYASEPNDPESYAHIWAEGDNGSAVASLHGWDGRDVEPDAALIAAAGTAASEVVAEGYDPVEAVRSIKDAYKTLGLLRNNLDAVIRNMEPSGERDALIDSVMEADMLLTHVRASGKEGE